jgi:hypothetical protein
MCTQRPSRSTCTRSPGEPSGPAGGGARKWRSRERAPWADRSGSPAAGRVGDRTDRFVSGQPERRTRCGHACPPPPPRLSGDADCVSGGRPCCARPTIG